MVTPTENDSKQSKFLWMKMHQGLKPNLATNDFHQKTGKQKCSVNLWTAPYLGMHRGIKSSIKII